MALAIQINPSSTIRPLGEEHLRMFRRMVNEHETAPRISMSKEAPKLPKAISKFDFRVRGKKYALYRYPYGKGPNLEQAIKIAELLSLQMLTVWELEPLESKLEKMLEVGESGHIQNHDTTQLYFWNLGPPDGIITFGSRDPDHTANVLVLKR